MGWFGGYHLPPFKETPHLVPCGPQVLEFWKVSLRNSSISPSVVVSSRRTSEDFREDFCWDLGGLRFDSLGYKKTMPHGVWKVSSISINIVCIWHVFQINVSSSIFWVYTISLRKIRWNQPCTRTRRCSPLPFAPVFYEVLSWDLFCASWKPSKL